MTISNEKKLSEEATHPVGGGRISLFRHFVKRGFQALGTLFICFMALLVWLFVSQTGLTLMVRLAGPLAPGTLQIEEIQGRLSKGVRLKGFEYIQGDIHAKIAQLEWAWDPTALLDRALIIETIHAQDVELHLPQNQDSEPPSQHPVNVEIPSINLPFYLKLNRAQIDRLTLHMGEVAPLFVDQVQLELSAKDTLQLTTRLQSPFLNAEANGELELAAPHAVHLTWRWQGTLSPTLLPEIKSDLRQGGGQGTITGNMATLHFSHELQAPLRNASKINSHQSSSPPPFSSSSTYGGEGGEVNGQGIKNRPLRIQLEGQVDLPLAGGPLEDLTWRASLNLPEAWTVPDELVSPRITLSPTTVLANGDLKAYTVSINSGVGGETFPSINRSLPPINLSLNAQGNSSGVEIESLHARLLDGDIQGTAAVNWQDALTATLQWQGTGLNLKPLWPDWPETLTLNHQLRLHFANQKLNIETLDLTLLPTKGQLALRGTVFLQPEITWDIEMVGKKFDPGNQWPQWPGELDVDLYIQGKMNQSAGNQSALNQVVANEPLIELHVQLKELAGVLRGYPFHADGQFSMQGDEYHLQDFNLHSGDAVFNAKAHLGDALDAAWSIAVPHLEALYPQAEGKLFSQGNVGGNLDNPTLNVQLDGDNLSFESFKLAKVNLEAAFLPTMMASQRGEDSQSLTASQANSPSQVHTESRINAASQSHTPSQIHDTDKIRLTFSSRDLTRGETVLWESFDLNTTGTIGSHQWALDLKRPQEVLTMKADGIYALGKPDLYQLVLQDLEAKTDVVGDWQLQNSSRMGIQIDKAHSGLTSLYFDKICMGQDAAKICANAAWDGKKELDAEWVLSIPQLKKIFAQAEGKRFSQGKISGQLFSQGKISGELTRPTVSAQLDGEALGFDTFKLDKVSLTASSLPNINPKRKNSDHLNQKRKNSDRLNDQDHILFEFSSRNLTQDQTVLWESLNLNTKGTIGSHQWRIDLKRPQEALAMKADGIYSLGKPDLYQLVLQTLDAKTKIAGNWQLRRPSPMEIRMGEGQSAVKSVSVDDICLGRASADVCVRGKWTAKEASQFALALNKLPLALAKPFLPEKIDLKGDLSGDMDGVLQPDGQVKANASLQLSPGNVTILLEDEPQVFPIRGGTLALHLDPDQGTYSQLALELLSDSFIKGDVRLPRQTGLSFTPEQTIQGNVGVKFSDMQLIAALIQPVEKSGGEVTLSAAVDGLLTQPKIKGDLAGKELTAEIPELGITIKQFDLDARADGGNRIDLKSTLTSGEGRLSTTGIITLGEKEIWQADLSIKGEELAVINIPDVTASISPDLTLSANPETLTLRGKIVIPKAEITPNVVVSGSSGGAGIVRESDDVVIINPLNEDPGDIPSKPSVPLNPDLLVDVILGPDVTVDVVDFKSRLGGAIGLNLSSGQTMPQGRGEVQIINGTYRAYGQDLEIPKGRILFSGGDITNPGLNISAIRTIYQDKSSNNVKAAGVQITGRAQNPHLRFFSDPMMENAQILSYIVTGSGLNTEQKSLSLGTYLTPKLYVSAGLSLFDQSKVFNLRYELSRKWGVEANVGDLDSGVDISYTIGR